MERIDYGIISQEDLSSPVNDATITHHGISNRLGCKETFIDAYRLDGGSVSVSSHYEKLCLPIGNDGIITFDESLTVPVPEIAFIPDGQKCTLASANRTVWLVISVPGESDNNAEPVRVDPFACTYSPPETSSILTARLTDQLGCTGMKVNLRKLQPDEWVPYHTEGRQEELFIPRTGSGAMRIADRRYQMSKGSIARLAPETPRSAVNDTTTEVVWVMVGSPATGGVDEWDPGATILE